MERSAERPCR
uniref:Uncharacterized protein n=1 Tax=Arundo donax TaxID=35708 RepID=A0A0A8ZPS9_ARUDO